MDPRAWLVIAGALVAFLVLEAKLRGYARERALMDALADPMKATEELSRRWRLSKTGVRDRLLKHRYR